MLRLADNPPMTFPPEADLGEVGGAWRAAYTKPRQEKLLAWDLQRLGIPYFLPLLQRDVVSAGRRRTGVYPLFASYLFFAGDDAARLEALKTDRIVRLLDPQPAQQAEFRRQLSAICRALRAAPSTVRFHPHAVRGTRVVVRAGALQGVEGIVLEDRSPKRLWIGVSLLGVSATVEISADLVEAC